MIRGKHMYQIHSQYNCINFIAIHSLVFVALWAYFGLYVVKRKGGVLLIARSPSSSSATAVRTAVLGE